MINEFYKMGSMRRRDYSELDRRIAAVVSTLPGSIPYDNHRPLRVKGHYDGLPLLVYLQRVHPHLSPHYWQNAIATGNLLLNGNPLSKETKVRSGHQLTNIIPNTVEPDVNAHLRILHDDPWMMVLDKPAPLPVHPCGRFNKNTASMILKMAFPESHLRPVHRLDANTTGVLILAKSTHAARELSSGFENRLFKKVYLVKILGHPPLDHFQCDAPILNTPQQGGTRTVGDLGLPSLTRFRTLRRLDDGTSILEVNPITGRTNQIRIHLSALGYSVVGDSAYGTDISFVHGMSQQSVLYLHCWKIEIQHPFSEKEMVLETCLPSWVSDTIPALC